MGPTDQLQDYPTVPAQNCRVFQERLTHLMEGDSARSFARKVGMSDTFLRKLLRGDGEPTLGTLQKIAMATAVSVSWLIGESDEREEALPPVVPEGFAQRLRLAWTGELPALLQRSGVAKADFLDYMTGNRLPDEDTVRRIAKATGVSPTWLAAGIGRKKTIKAAHDLGMVVGNIKDLIKETGGVWSFSQAVGVSTNHVQELVSDAACPSYSLLAEIARTCRRSLYWLLTGEDEPGDSAQQMQAQNQQLAAQEPPGSAVERWDADTVTVAVLALDAVLTRVPARLDAAKRAQAIIMLCQMTELLRARGDGGTAAERADTLRAAVEAAAEHITRLAS